ncbi:MAG: phosphatidate cytidylyltransferase [Planctomycetota bacterium]|nr:phosphatidate cytidylyltransferase [Planctomycetota bacterium]
MTAGDAPQKKPLTSRQRIVIRLICAPLILGVVIGLLILHHRTGNPTSTFVLLALMGAVGGYELAALLRRADPGVSLVHATVVCGALCAVGLLAPDDVVLRAELRLGFVTTGVLALLFQHLTNVRREAASHIAYGCVPMLYVGLLFSAMTEIASGPEGAMRCLFVVLVAKCSDMGGWLVGKPFGKHKMVPTVSPGKSWEGTAGGIAMSVAAAVFLPSLLGLELESGWSVAGQVGFGVLLAVVSILAGVTQSGFKRRVDAKDSSTLIPEMGGVLDMIDSLLFAGPAAYLWYRLALG